jgi:hypothetical protein
MSLIGKIICIGQFVMNSTDALNSTALNFTFTIADGTMLSFQLLTFIITLIIIFLFLLLRKEKEFKYRGCLPYLSIFGVCLLMLKFILIFQSSIRINLPTSFTERFVDKKILF